MDETTNILISVRSDMYNYAIAVVHDPMDADDLVSQVILKVWNLVVKGKFKPKGNEIKWYCITAIKNTIYDMRRKGKYRSDDEIPTDLPCSPQISYDAEVILSWIDEMPYNIREVGLLHIEGYSYKEICDIMDYPIGTVCGNLYNFRNRIRNKLSQEGKLL